MTSAIEKAYNRIKPYVTETPVLQSETLNGIFGNTVFFKAECFQRTGSFKFRGAMNALLSIKEREGRLPEKAVTFSSGNHAQALAAAGKIAGIAVRIHTPSFSSKVKMQAAAAYGAEIIYSPDRATAEIRARQDIANGYRLIPPFDDEDILLGQGTACLEALKTEGDIEAIFAACGGGGWLAGAYSAKELLSPESLLFAAEPEEAADGYRSYLSGKIEKLPAPSMTIADGARTECVGKKTFPYLLKTDNFYTVSEERIIYWTQWLNHLLKIRVEPTSAVAMGALEQRVSETGMRGKRLLVLLSGGNIDRDTELKIWERDFLEDFPSLPLMRQRVI